jgi:drug/metabolite transporter (DMT)-like permease
VFTIKNDALAVVLALFAAFCFALGSLVQQAAARQTHGRALRLGLLVTLLREEKWLGGLALTVFSFGVQAAALAFGPLALVQPLATIDVLFAIPLIAYLNRRPLTRRSIIGGLCIAAGMAAFVAVSPPTSGVGVPGIADWIPALAGIAVLAAAGGFVALRRQGKSRVILLAATAALTYGVLDALTKSTVDILPHRGWGILTTWEPYALLVAGILGTLLGQSAFNAGPLSLSLPVVDTVEPTAAVVLAAVVFHESLARTPWHLALQLLGAAVAVTGIALLSHSCLVIAEDRRESGVAAADPSCTTLTRAGGPWSDPASVIRCHPTVAGRPFARMTSRAWSRAGRPSAAFSSPKPPGGSSAAIDAARQRM